MLIDGLEWCGLLCGVFISCLDSHSDGTHSLQRIHWWVNDVMLHFSKTVPMKKQTHLHLGWPVGKYILKHIFILGELFLSGRKATELPHFHIVFIITLLSYKKAFSFVSNSSRSSVWHHGFPKVCQISFYIWALSKSVLSHEWVTVEVQTLANLIEHRIQWNPADILKVIEMLRTVGEGQRGPCPCGNKLPLHPVKSPKSGVVYE